MSLSVAARQRITKEIAEKWSDRRKENLMKVLDEGWLVFAKGKPQERLAGYVANTLDIDVPFVTDPEYIEKLAAGQVPMLYAIQRIQQRQIEASVIATLPPEAMDLVREPQTPAPPMLWPIVVGKLPPYVFEKLSKDMRDLLRAQSEKEPERTQPFGVMSGVV